MVKAIHYSLFYRLFCVLLCLVLFVISFAPMLKALSLSPEDQKSIYNDTVWYKSDDSNNSSFCLGGPGGSGPLYGPFFPKVSDTAALAQAISSYITSTRPDSPLISHANEFVGYGQQYNVNPALIVAIAQKETSLGTAGNALAPQYNVFNVRNGDAGSFGNYASISDSIQSVNKLISGSLYLGPPANETTISAVISTYAPSSENDTNAYIKFVGGVMQKILGNLSGSPGASADSCPSGTASGSGPVEEGTNAELAKKILDYRSSGQYSCDNPGDCADLQKIVNGQSLSGSSGCQAQTLDTKVLQLMLYIIENGKFKLGTYALCGDHSNDGPNGHSGGKAVDISTINGAALNQDTAQAGAEGLKMDQFLNNLPAGLALNQQISYGYGGHYSQPMAALQQYNGQLCNSSCVSIYGSTTESEHTNHIHAGY
jgi:hypothetical protein